ncbi:MAG: pyroglutamyl-peptidase I [Bacillota bacterium]|nr:pyroglutamyl-peptidase I [Bacillota bacterium]
MKVLVTGFEPFGGVEGNPSEDVLPLLPDALGPIQIVKQVLPVAFVDSGWQIAAALTEERPDLVLCLGLKSGAMALELERIAINLDDAYMPDNAGDQPRERPILPHGPDGIFSPLPLKRMQRAIQSTGVPAQLSNSAGTYVCNHVFYVALATARELSPPPPVGFIHLPLTPQLALSRYDRPSMTLEDMRRGLVAALATAIDAL